MGSHPRPIVFLSHSHRDKRVARRLVRRFTAYGIKIWIDESDLQFGASLTEDIRQHIETADVLLVIASQTSAESEWVGLEVDYAREHHKTIIPFFVAPLSEHARFRNYLGVDATAPQAFADVVEQLMLSLFRSAGLKPQPVDPAVVAAGLRDLAREEPDLAPLIVGCLDSEGLHGENMETVFRVAFHAVDDALNALFELKPCNAIAYHAAAGFRTAGAGVRALSSWIAATGNGELPLVNAVGSPLQPELIPTAIKLLGSCSPPNDHALYQFIHHNAAAFDDAQRKAVIRLVTWPVRADTDGLTDVLGWVALKHFPESMEIQQMFMRWIRNGAFDGKPKGPMDLAGQLADAHNENLTGWGNIHKALRDHVREYLRSGDKKKVFVATDHIQAAADSGAPVLASLLRETEGVSGTAEWNGWKKRDPETAEWMGWYVFEIAQQAQGARDWLRAPQHADKMAAFEKLMRKTDAQ